MISHLALLTGREPSGYLEVRSFPSGRPTQAFFKRDQLQAAANLIGHQSASCDVFVGAAPRQQRSGGKQAVKHSWCLWVDIDSPDYEQRLSLAPVAPSLVVGSGSGGCHAYWALTNVAPVSMVERANRRLAHLLGADMRCTDASRILRPVGSFNHKHKPPRPVGRVGGHGRLVSMMLVADLPDPPGAAANTRVPARVVRDDRLLGISSQEYVPVLSGRSVSNTGLVRCPFPSHSGGQERTPSLKVWDDPARGWCCFGCSTGGDIYSFASRLWGVPARGQGFAELRERLTRELL